MDIKKTYSYFLKQNLKITGFVYLIIVGVTTLILLFAMVLGEKFGITDLAGLIPNFFTVVVVSFILSIISNRTIDLACNQFGKSRKTAYLSNILVMLSISIIIALLFSTLLSFFYQSQYEEYLSNSREIYAALNYQNLYSGSDIRFVSLFSFWLYNFSYYTFLAFASATIGIFMYSLWVRLEKIYRWIVFVFIPVVCAYLIPKALINYFLHNDDPIKIFTRLMNFFGLDNGFAYQFIFVSTLVCIIPTLILAYFVMLKKPLYGKKK